MHPRTPYERIGAQAPARQEPQPPSFIRRHLAMLLGSICGVLICAIALAALLAVHGNAPAPDPTAQALCADLSAQDYNSAYQLLAPALQSAGSEGQFAASQRELDILSGKITACGYSIRQDDQATATITLSVTRQRTGAASGTVHLTLSHGEWKVADYDASVL